MNNEILDLDQEKNDSTLNTKSAIFFSVVSILMLIKYYFDLPYKLASKEIVLLFYYSLRSFLPIPIILGSYYSLAAIFTKESDDYKKWVSAFINFTLFLMVLIAAVMTFLIH